MALEDNVVFAHFGDALQEDDPGDFTLSNPSGLTDPNVNSGVLEFDGSEGQTHTGASTWWNPGSGSWSIALRAKITDIDPNTNGRIFRIGTADSWNNHIECTQSANSGSIRFQRPWNPTNFRVTAIDLASDDTWFTVVCVYDGTGLELFDELGNSLGTSTDTITQTGSDIITLGSAQDGTVPLTGALDWIVVWDRELTAAELANNMNETDLKNAILASDSTAPTYGTAPALDTVDDTSATFTATASDETASQIDHYMGLYAAGSTPSAADIKAGTGTGFVAGSADSDLAVNNGVEATFAPSATLTGATNYRAAFTVEEAGGGNLATPVYVDFRTSLPLDHTVAAIALAGQQHELAFPTKISMAEAIRRRSDGALITSRSDLEYFFMLKSAWTGNIAGSLPAPAINGNDGTVDASGQLQDIDMTGTFAYGVDVIGGVRVPGAGESAEDLYDLNEFTVT